MTTLPSLALYVYGILLVVGGVIGYAKAGSRGSLVTGSVAGLLAFLFGYYGTHSEARTGAIILGCFLGGLMTWRFIKTRKPMPALPIILLSVVVAALQLM
jgi:uncharacterized membrane protein (UPF0136 family)